jgi:hypothetical protein
MKVTLARVPVTTRWLVAALASALVLLGAILASAVMTTETSATWLASSSVSPGGIGLSPHDGGGIYKHIWLDAIGPQVSVPHVDTSVHQSR